jgi:dTDP-4-amino-4,6-dideoxygalactose transaminase
MNEIEAAIGIVQLNKLDSNNRIRIKNAFLYTSLLKDVKGIITPQVFKSRKHVFHQYTIRITSEYGISRELLQTELLRHGIETEVYYPLPINKQKIYKQMNTKMPIAERFARQVLSLPVHPSVTASNIRRVCSIISSFEDKSRNKK